MLRVTLSVLDTFKDIAEVSGDLGDGLKDIGEGFGDISSACGGITKNLQSLVKILPWLLIGLLAFFIVTSIGVKLINKARNTPEALQRLQIKEDSKIQQLAVKLQAKDQNNGFFDRAKMNLFK